MGGDPISLNQRVQGSSPCAPTIEQLEIIYQPDTEDETVLTRMFTADPMRTRERILATFDLLGLESDDLRERPLEERREALARVRQGARAVPRGHRVEARRQPLLQRPDAQLA
jgi:hypothetical protein